MARYGVVGDVHGSAEALEATLRRFDQAGIDELLCVGDLVGFNAAGDEVAERLSQSGAVCVAGNHDRIALGRLGLGRCWYQVEHALGRTREALSDRTKEYLAGLPLLRDHGDDLLLFHGAVDDVERYSRGCSEMERNHALVEREQPRARVCFYGHTHKPAVHAVGADGRARLVAREGRVDLTRPNVVRWFVNPGSVDAARRDDVLARAAIYDDVGRTVQLFAVPYDKYASERRARREGYRVSVAVKVAHEAEMVVRRSASGVMRVVRAAARRRRGG